MKTLKVKSILFSLLAILAVSVFMTSCEQQPTPTLIEQMEQYDLGVQEYTGKKIQGQTIIIGHNLGYEAIENDKHYKVTILLDDKKFDVEIGYSPNYYVIDGYGVKLNNEEKYVLSDFAGSLADAISDRSGNSGDVMSFYLVEKTLVTVISLLGEAPQNHAIENIKYANEIGTTSEERYLFDDGVTCIKIGSRYTITYDEGGNGRVHAYMSPVVEQESLCRGRCGPLCNAWIGGWVWTLDCLEHDFCVQDIGSSIGPNDANCWDEFWNAADDYMFAGWCDGN